MLYGLLGGFAAALCYGLASVLQAVAVRQLIGMPTGQAWPARLWAARWYAAGLCLDGLGFLASVLALRTLPLFLVQALVAASIGVTAVFAAAFLGVRLSRGQVARLVVLAIGLTALAGSAPEQKPQGLAGVGPWLLLTGALPLAAVMVATARAAPRRGFVPLAVCAGLGFAGVGISARVLVIPQPWWHLAGEPVAWALAAYGVQSAVCFGMALAKGPVTVATALALGVETIVPGAIGLAVLGDRVRPGFGPVAATGFVLAVGSCLALARRPVATAGPQS